MSNERRTSGVLAVPMGCGATTTSGRSTVAADDPALPPLPQAVTAACGEGDHDRCRCLLPGRDRRWSGLVVDWDDRIGGFRPVAVCSCWCHDNGRVVG